MSHDTYFINFKPSRGGASVTRQLDIEFLKHLALLILNAVISPCGYFTFELSPDYVPVKFSKAEVI